MGCYFGGQSPLRNDSAGRERLPWLDGEALMFELGQSMVEIAVVKILRKYERDGAIRQGSGSSGGMFGGWSPGMGDEGGLGPITEATLRAIATDVAVDIGKQLDKAELTDNPASGGSKKRERPSWLRVVKPADEPVSEPEKAHPFKGSGIICEDCQETPHHYCHDLTRVGDAEPAAPAGASEKAISARTPEELKAAIISDIENAAAIVERVPDVEPAGLTLLGGGPQEEEPSSMLPNWVPAELRIDAVSVAVTCPCGIEVKTAIPKGSVVVNCAGCGIHRSYVWSGDRSILSVKDLR